MGNAETGVLHVSEHLGMYEQEVRRLTHERDLLAAVIVRCSKAAGGVDPDIADAGLTGPQVLLLGNDLADYLEGLVNGD